MTRQKTEITITPENMTGEFRLPSYINISGEITIQCPRTEEKREVALFLADLLDEQITQSVKEVADAGTSESGAVNRDASEVLERLQNADVATDGGGR